MALFPLNPGIQPIGMFDILNTDASSILGGEVMTLASTSITNTSTETAASDVFDGYIATGVDTGTTTRTRLVARIASTSYQGTPYYYAFYLADEGTAGYGVLVGTVIGSSTGLVTGSGASTATNVGPSSLAGSGKVTLWNQPGLYAITLDAVDHSATLTSAIVAPTTASGAFDTPLPGAILGINATGLLCRYVSGPIVAQFVELTGSGGRVQTNARIFGGAPTTSQFDRVVIQWAGAGYRTIS
jgi:hypothetical protein